MTRSEQEARKIFSNLGRIPRKKKKRFKKAIKIFLTKEIDNGNWDVMDSLSLILPFDLKIKILQLK